MRLVAAVLLFITFITNSFAADRPKIALVFEGGYLTQRRSRIRSTTRQSIPRGVRIRIDERRALGTIPHDFLGLGYEISSVATEGLLSAENRDYVRLVNALGPAGVIRVGGITADFASYAPAGRAVATPRGTVVNERNLRELGMFLKATGWTLIWALNLGNGEVDDAVKEATAVAAAVGEGRVAFEIGNEPDLFNRGAFAHRPSTYGYEDWLAEYRRFKSAIRTKLPKALFAGPDAATLTDWVTRLAQDEGSDLQLLTHHYYRECASAASTFDKLLRPDPKLQPLLEKLAAAAKTSGVPYRICETNSFCGGGKPGVSDTFGAALWALDFLWQLAEGGCAGVNLETGVNQLDFVSSYSPIVDNKARPEYYGMLAFAQVVGGKLVPVKVTAKEVNLTAYAAVMGDKKIVVTAVNKDTARDAQLSIETDGRYRVASVKRLTGPGLDAKEGVAFGATAEKNLPLWVPAGSAAVVTLTAH